MKKTVKKVRGGCLAGGIICIIATIVSIIVVCIGAGLYFTLDCSPRTSTEGTVASIRVIDDYSYIKLDGDTNTYYALVNSKIQRDEHVIAVGDDINISYMNFDIRYTENTSTITIREYVTEISLKSNNTILYSNEVFTPGYNMMIIAGSIGLFTLAGAVVCFIFITKKEEIEVNENIASSVNPAIQNTNVNNAVHFCYKCGTKLDDGVRYCPICGTQIEQEYSYTSQGGKNSVRSSNYESLGEAAKIFMIISCVVTGLCLIPLAWTIPMTVSVSNKLKTGEHISVGMKICTLFFVNTIAGILLLCMGDNEY